MIKLSVNTNTKYGEQLTSQIRIIKKEDEKDDERDDESDDKDFVHHEADTLLFAAGERYDSQQSFKGYSYHI